MADQDSTPILITTVTNRSEVPDDDPFRRLPKADLDQLRDVLDDAILHLKHLRPRAPYANRLDRYRRLRERVGEAWIGAED
jgi:hypothetical protein